MSEYVIWVLLLDHGQQVQAILARTPVTQEECERKIVEIEKKLRRSMIGVETSDGTILGRWCDRRDKAQ